MRPPNYNKQFIHLLEELVKTYPTYNMGRHISTAFADYGDIWGTPTKELCFALEKYMTELALDENQVVSEKYVQEILSDGEHLFDVQQEEDEY